MSDNPIFRVPPEIWEKISEKINSSKDLVNFGKAFPRFKNTVHTKRVEWLCYQILPVLATNVYCNTYNSFGKDFLKCRLVCKHWKFAVDNFLENNVLHYPASGDDVAWKLNKCHFGQTYYLCLIESIFGPFSLNRLEFILREASSHPSNPIVGRYVSIVVSDDGELSEELINLIQKFLETFGRHIYYLELHFAEEQDPTVFLSMLLRFVRNVPNLKGLTIHKTWYSFDNHKTNHSLNYIKRELYKINTNTEYTASLRNVLPKLETLTLRINGLASSFLQSTIINMFSMEKLKSLTVVQFSNVEGKYFSFPNLLHLSLNIANNEQLESVLDFSSPKLCKLDFGKMRYNDLNCDLLYAVLQKFEQTLTHLTLYVPDILNIENKGLKKKMNRFFRNRNILQMPNIKTVSLFGKCPPSLNFLSGGSFGSLKYFNFYFNNFTRDGKRSFHCPNPAATKTEITDVIQRLSPLWADGQNKFSGENDMLKSNIWSVFPRLKGILIDDYRDPLNKNGWTYRRNDIK